MNFSTEREIRELIRRELSGISPIQPINSRQNETEADTTSLSARIDELKTAIDAIKKDEGLVNQDLNYTTRGTYEGNEVRFSLFGQVLTQEEANEFGDINYIEFGGGGSLHPFKITSVLNSSDPPTYTISVNAGTINGIIASNWNDDFIRNDQNPVYVVLSVFTDGRSVDSSVLSLDSSPPPTTSSAQKWNLSGSFQVLIGAVAGTIVKQVVFNNLSASGKKVLTTEKLALNMNELPYDNWYAWEVR